MNKKRTIGEVYQQAWYCEQCRAKGQVKVKHGNGFWETKTGISRAHKRAMPECHELEGITYIRIPQTKELAPDVAAENQGQLTEV